MAEHHLKNVLDDFLANLPKQGSTVASHLKADLLLVNCIDCRYPHAIHQLMHDSEEYKDKIYDHLVLAGASLAAVKKYTHRKYWSKTFLEHVGLSIDLHSIDGVLILDHRTCGAFVKMGLIPEHPEVPDKAFEFQQHQMVAQEAAEQIVKVFRKKNRQGTVSIFLTPEIAVGGVFSEPLLPLASMGA